MANYFDDENNQGGSSNSEQGGGSHPTTIDVPITVEWAQKGDPPSRPSPPENNF